MEQFLLFDLDGTLTDPAPGITASCRYALTKMGRPVPDQRTLLRYIGPPLVDSFQKYNGMTPGEAREALRLYREYFGVRGLFENEVYPGIPEMLDRLRRGGYTLMTATSKPYEYSVRILEHFGLLSYFTYVGANTMDETRADKAAVIRHVMEKCPAICAENTRMIGDREYDIRGAHTCGLPAVGILYGYGTREELTAAGADTIAETVGDLGKILLRS